MAHAFLLYIVNLSHFTDRMHCYNGEKCVPAHYWQCFYFRYFNLNAKRKFTIWCHLSNVLTQKKCWTRHGKNKTIARLIIRLHTKFNMQCFNFHTSARILVSIDVHGVLCPYERTFSISTRSRFMLTRTTAFQPRRREIKIKTYLLKHLLRPYASIA